MSNVIDATHVLNQIKKNFNGNCGHGLSCDDFEELHRLLKTAKSNDTDAKTEFPDFVSDCGFIEHFHVTSGRSSRSGYDETAAISKHQQIHQNFLNNDKNIQNEVARCCTCHVRKDNSIENFHKSFIAAWNKHMRHLQDYHGNKHISCFLISSDDTLNVFRRQTDLCLGDLIINNPKFCLAYDLELLNFISTNAQGVDYVIYYNIGRSYIEAIKVSNIPVLCELLKNQQLVIDTLPYQSENMSTIKVSGIF